MISSKISQADGRRLVLHHIGILLFFLGGHIENWLEGPKISSVNILITNHGVQ